jgi:hypothetical protein
MPGVTAPIRLNAVCAGRDVAQAQSLVGTLYRPDGWRIHAQWLFLARCHSYWLGRAAARYHGRGGVSFAIVGAGGAGITAEDSVLVSGTGQVLGSVGKMSDPLATIAKRLVYPFPAPREQRRSG